MSLDNLITGESTIGGEFLDPCSSCVSGLFSTAFNSDSSRRHPYPYITPLCSSSVKSIPLIYGVIDGYVLET